MFGKACDNRTRASSLVHICLGLLIPAAVLDSLGIDGLILPSLMKQERAALPSGPPIMLPNFRSYQNLEVLTRDMFRERL